MIRTTMIGMLLFWGWTGLSASGLVLSAYGETVDLRADGSAEIRLSMTMTGGGMTELRIPVRHAALTGLRSVGAGLSGLHTEQRQDVHYLVAELASSSGETRTIDLVYQVPDYFAGDGKSGSFGARDLEYRFVNVSFEGIAAFSARLMLPEGWVFHQVNRFLPQPKKTGTAPPYRLDRVEGRRLVEITLTEIGLGDEVVLDCAFRSESRSKVVMVFLILAALAYLIFFRDILKGGSKSKG